jgi:hypothetical protein
MVDESDAAEIPVDRGTVFHFDPDHSVDETMTMTVLSQKKS